jgi:glutathione-regulated potassium-efflux system ancillary protein KefG
MKSILILFAHPMYQRSRVHRCLAREVKGMEGVTFHDLYEEYPSFYIQAKREQALLCQHDIVIFEHPLYWYSGPAILKEWQDLVLEHGFAYGQGGTALRGKWLLSVVSTGGAEQGYRHGGIQRFTMREFLVPFDQMAHLCGMEYLPPFVVYGSYQLTLEQIEAHARDYRRLLEGLRDERVDLASVRALSSLNSDLTALLPSEMEGGR